MESQGILTKLRKRSLENLKMYSEKFHQTILANILRIQRWFRAKRQKHFFRDLVKNDRISQRRKLKELLFDMDTSIKKLEKDTEDRLAGKDSVTSRDRIQEKVEEA